MAGAGVGQDGRIGGNSGQPSVAEWSCDMQSWCTARLQRQHQMPPMTRVSSQYSMTRTERGEPQA